MDATARTLQELTDRLDALEAENRLLRQRAESRTQPVESAADGSAISVISRRKLVLGGGAAALGAAVVTASSTPAAAAPGAPLALEQGNPVNAPTSMSGDIRDMPLAGGPDASDVFTSVLSASNQHPNVGTGFYGYAQSYGVCGLASGANGTGVFGRSDVGGTGVHGWVYGDAVSSPVSDFTAGVWGQVSSSYPTAPAFLADGQIALRTLPNPGGAPASEGAVAGDLTIRREADGTATWWVCVEEASEGDDATFVRLAAPDSGGAFEPLPAPIRVYESRPGEAPATGPKTPLAVGTDRTIDCTLNTAGAVPTDARVLWINLAATQSTDAGYLAAHSADASWGGTANLNYAAGQDVSNAVTVRCDEGRITIRAGGPSGSVHFIVDVIGFSR